MKMKMFLLLIMVTFASEQKENDAENLILVKIEEDEYTKVHKTSQYIGVSYTNEKTASWRAERWSKYEKKNVYNGCNYKDEETAAHASDTLARNLMENGEQNLKLNFPDDDTEVNAGVKTSEYVGVSYCDSNAKWQAFRWSKYEKKIVCNGCSYRDEGTAAHASDTLARKLMKNGEQNHKLNFPDDDTEVNAEKDTSSIFIGVCYDKNKKLWRVRRWSKTENRQLYNGYYKDEGTAALASDTLARKLMENGEQNLKLNFPDNDTKRQTNKRKRSENEHLGHSQNK